VLLLKPFLVCTLPSVRALNTASTLCMYRHEHNLVPPKRTGAGVLASYKHIMT
jgi:hypothetical protein